MILTCRRTDFEFHFDPKMLKIAQSEKPPIRLPLTVGRTYHVSVVSRLDKGGVGAAFDWNALQPEKFALVVFTDNKVWEEIEIPQAFVPPELRSYSPLNQLLKSVFDDPASVP